METSNLVLTVIAAVLGTGGLGALATLWIRRRLVPVERDGLILVQAKEAMTMAREISTDLRKEMEQMRAQFTAEIRHLRIEVAELRAELAVEHVKNRTLSRKLEAWWDWHYDLIGRWWHHRTKDHPPPGPNVESEAPRDPV